MLNAHAKWPNVWNIQLSTQPTTYRMDSAGPHYMFRILARTCSKYEFLSGPWEVKGITQEEHSHAF